MGNGAWGMVKIPNALCPMPKVGGRWSLSGRCAVPRKTPGDGVSRRLPINLAKTFPGIDDGSGFPLLGASKMRVIS
ncbi:MAG: hypothetical protein ACFKPT_23900 [Gloeotrichia echinulata GP01]